MPKLVRISLMEQEKQGIMQGSEYMEELQKSGGTETS